MQQKHLKTLEYPKILDRLAAYTLFAASKALALELQPSPYFNEVQARQEETTEAVRLLQVKPNLSIGGARDVRPLLDRIQRGGILLPAEFLEIRQTLIAGRDLQRAIIRLAESYSRLADIAARIEECPGIVNDIGQAIDERGEVKDSASSALARIRRDIETSHGRLLEKLNRLVASSQYQHYLQEALVTQRQGRYVIPLKTEFKGKIQGVVHDQSASGATIFVEPLSTVELNNKWRQLQLAEDEEIRKILAELSTAVQKQARLIEHTVVALADLDLAFAKAKYAEAIAGIEPTLLNLADKQPRHQHQTEQKQRPAAAPAPHIHLLAARHPLLDPETVVPIDITLAADTKMLVITGPNTGGKTVSLKTMGVLTSMAQAGLHIPTTEPAVLPVFKQIFADIGDEQSIEQSLSTFSSHMTNIVKILIECDEQSLVVFDELGAGTDPIEGSALARAILTHLLQKRVTTFVATHYSELKAFAHTTNEVSNASMEFDLESLAPTYRLQIGLPGASNAFAIAQRLGLSQAIINEAQGLIGENAQAVEAMLAEIRAQIEAAHNIRRQAEEEQAQAEAYKRSLQRRLEEIDTERRDILSSVRADARREIKAVRQEIRTLKEQAQQALPQQEAITSPDLPPSDLAPPTEMDLATVEDQLENVERAVIAKEKPKTQPPQKRGGPLRPGDKVFINQFNTVGQVVEIQNKQVEVQLGQFRATVPLDEVELRTRQAQNPEPEKPASTVKLPAVESPGIELDLRGQIAEEAMLRLDQYLDQAFLARLPWVRIIHGKGSGVLRQVVRQELRGHPMISSYRSGESGEGGEGVTVAKLAVN